jgi:hypothetical protein
VKNISKEFNTVAENPFGAKYILKIVSLTDNTEIKDDINDFVYSAMINDDDAFTIGNTCSATISFSITNPTVNLNNKEIEVYQGLNVNGIIEYAKLGVFKVLKPTKDRNITRYQCVDRMTYLMNMPYSSNLTFPTTDLKILEEICSQTDISLIIKGSKSHSISNKPSGYTRREIIAYMSQLQGKNAKINSDGNLEIIWYTDANYVIDDNKIYYDGTSDINSEIDYKVEYIECTVRSLDGSEENVIKAGSGVNGIKIENPFMTQAILYEIANKLVGFTFRGAEFEFLGDFRLEVGDIVSVETNGEVYRVPIMQIEHKSDGGVVTTITSVGETDTENEIDLSSPNIHAMDRYYAELVLINKAMINKLSVDEADIRYLQAEQLDAIEANIENAVIKNLEGEFITVDVLDAERARITVLEANSLTSDSAIIKELEAGITKTNTLIFGSASGNTIQTEFSNSVIAQLGDAQIESAMIKEISALKITGLDLNTTKFTVHSEDGLSQWKDNTITIHDGVLGTPRIQIGKDGSGDYNMYIWNAQGKLMFDALGVTENGITRQIIRDDVVKDDANISASKLNIQSLFSTINDDTSYTLKSSKVYLDDEKQTLDVSFKVMSSNISGLQITQASQGTDISIIQGQISSKIWKQDITTAIDDIEIGGRNLVQNTSDKWEICELGQYFTPVVSLNINDLCEKYGLNDGDVLTYSVYLKTASGKTISARWQKWNSQSDRKGTISSEYITNGEGISTVQLVIDKKYTELQLLINNISTEITDTTIEYYRELKLEKGNKATDWSPSPEDVDANITTLSTKYSTLEQDIDVFKTTVSETYTTIEDFNNLSFGKTNYLTNSNFEHSFNGWGNTQNNYVIDEEKLFEGVKSAKISRSGLTSNSNVYLWQSYKEVVQPGDTFTASAYYYTDNISEIDSSTPRLYLDFYDADKKELEATSSYISLNLENGKWVRNSLTRVAPEGTVYVEAYICRFTRNGTLWIAKPQLEKSSKATDWAPALEDIQVEATSAKSVATQTANKFNWIVASGTSSSDFTLTDRMAELTAQIINLNGNVKVSGDMLVDGTITAEKLAVDAIKSRNVVWEGDDSGWVLIEGTMLDLQDGSFLSPNLSWDKYGNLVANNARFQSGSIGEWHIDTETNSLFTHVNYGGQYGVDYNVWMRAPVDKEDSSDFLSQWVFASAYNTPNSNDAYPYFYITTDGSAYFDDVVEVYDLKCTKFLSNWDAWEGGGLFTEKLVGSASAGINYCFWIEPMRNDATTDTHALFGGYQSANTTTPNQYEELWYVNWDGNALFDTVSATQYNNVSDRNKKHDIVNLNEQQCINVICAINPVSFKFNNTEYQRNHWGFVAQDVESALENLNISWQDFAVVDKTLHKTETMPGEKVQNSEETYDYYLRYEAFIAPIVAVEQNHEKRIQQLENDLAIANAIIQSLLIQQSTV